MKTKNLIKVVMLSAVFSTSVMVTHVHAGSKQKPPVVVTDDAVSWYDSILNLLGL